MKNVLIDSNRLDGVSEPFEIVNQVTVVALGLEPGDEVTFWLVILTKPRVDPCLCPPGQVVLPEIADEVQLTCCDEPIVLSRTRPFVVLDAPQGQKIRAKLNEAAPGVPSTQVVRYSETTTRNVNDRLRGCPCTVVEP